MNIAERYEKYVGALADEMNNSYPWTSRTPYASYLAQTYYYVLHSTPLLSLAAARFGFKDYDLHRRFVAHTEEERGHEFMAKKDLEKLGHTPDDFPELVATKAFYQRQYYLIEHVDPACFLGYVLALEGLATKMAGLSSEKVKAAYSEKCNLFLRAHSDEDPDHIEKAFKSLEKLTPDRLKLVEENMIATCELYIKMMREAATKFPEKSVFNSKQFESAAG